MCFKLFEIIVKALVGAFNHMKVLVGAFSVIVNVKIQTSKSFVSSSVVASLLHFSCV